MNVLVRRALGLVRQTLENLNDQDQVSGFFADWTGALWTRTSPRSSLYLVAGEGIVTASSSVSIKSLLPAYATATTYGPGAVTTSAGAYYLSQAGGTSVGATPIADTGITDWQAMTGPLGNPSAAVPQLYGVLRLVNCDATALVYYAGGGRTASASSCPLVAGQDVWLPCVDVTTVSIYGTGQIVGWQILVPT